jgi:phage-related protein
MPNWPSCRRTCALYVTAKEQRVVIVRTFIKKAEKTPTGEIDLALQRAKELKP